MIPLLKFASQLWLIKVGKAQRNNPLFFLKGCFKKKIYCALITGNYFIF